jgi:hypothetical protein
VTFAAKDGMAPSLTSPLMAVAATRPSVSKMPGITRLTLMPSGASSRRRASNAALRPRFDAAYIPTHAEGVIAPVEPMSTTSRRPAGAKW